MVFTCAAVAVRAGAWRKVLAGFAGLFLASLAVVPYLLALTRDRAMGRGIWLARNPRLYLARRLHVAIVLFPLWLFIAIDRRSLIERLRERSWVDWAALVSGLVLLLTFVIRDIPTADVRPG